MAPQLKAEITNMGAHWVRSGPTAMILAWGWPWQSFPAMWNRLQLQDVRLEGLTLGVGKGQGGLLPFHPKGHRGRMKMLSPRIVCCDKASSLNAAPVKIVAYAQAMHLRC